MRHLVIDQRQNAPNFSVFRWSPHGCLNTIGQHFVTTRVVHLPKGTETNLITNRAKAELITNYCSYARSAQLGPIRTRLCGPCIAAKAGSFIILGLSVTIRGLKVTILGLRENLSYASDITVILKPWITIDKPKIMDD